MPIGGQEGPGGGKTTYRFSGELGLPAQALPASYGYVLLSLSLLVIELIQALYFHVFGDAEYTF